METQQQTINIDSPYIKLSVSTKGVYTWDIKILGLDVNELEKINDELKKRFKNETQGLIIGKEE